MSEKKRCDLHGLSILGGDKAYYQCGCGQTVPIPLPDGWTSWQPLVNQLPSIVGRALEERPYWADAFERLTGNSWAPGVTWPERLGPPPPPSERKHFGIPEELR